MSKIMKVVILCGGLGTRISEETINKPKPMVKIGRLPILHHIINYYIKFNFTDFIILTGYKANIIKNYFAKKNLNFNITFLYTGEKTLTGERLLKIKKKFSKNETFLLTYGDGLSNVDIKSLIKFHFKHKQIATLTAVRPPARFGEIYLTKKNLIKNFVEKAQVSTSWINGGFFVFNYKIFKFLKRKQMLEREPMSKLVGTKNLFAYSHTGFWQCLDTIRDKKILEEIYKKKNLLDYNVF
jgi:glucose-1-phosphate cytidylyltransferase